MSPQSTITLSIFRLLTILLLMNAASAQEADDEGSSQPLDAEAISQIIDLEPVDSQRKRAVPIRVYLPAATQPRPVVLVSHGLGGSRQSKAYLGNSWSQAGFACVFLQHAGSDREVVRTTRPRQRMETLRQAANAANNLARIKDVSFAIDQLQAWNQQSDHALFQKLDLAHIGMSGHSFGAATTLSVAGRMYPLQQSYHEPRITAFLALSPQPARGLSLEQTFGKLRVPIMCMTGTKDTSPIDAGVTADARQSVYRAMPAGDKYQLVLAGGEHHAFGDERLWGRAARDPNHHPAIVAITTKFWQAYLEDDANAKAWLQSDQPRTDAKLASEDVWQWK